MKKLLLIGMLLFSFVSAFGQASMIKLTQENSNGTNDGGSRTISVEPTAVYDGSSVIINFPMYTTSQVVVRDAETGAVVYSASYDATRQVVVNLSSLPEGTYELHVYAFGKWWWGEFELEED